MKKINKILAGLLVLSFIIAGIRVYNAYGEYQTKTFELRLEQAELQHKLDSVMWYNPGSSEVSELYEQYCDVTLKIHNVR
jgi:hypothetical protein